MKSITSEDFLLKVSREGYPAQKERIQRWKEFASPKPNTMQRQPDGSKLLALCSARHDYGEIHPFYTPNIRHLTSSRELRSWGFLTAWSRCYAFASPFPSALHHNIGLQPYSKCVTMKFDERITPPYVNAGASARRWLNPRLLSSASLLAPGSVGVQKRRDRLIKESLTSHSLRAP
jgi:hypothetical protein